MVKFDYVISSAWSERKYYSPVDKRCYSPVSSAHADEHLSAILVARSICSIAHVCEVRLIYGRKHTWMFRAVERGTASAVLFVAADGTRTTLEALRAQRVLPGSVLVSDVWTTYNELGAVVYTMYVSGPLIDFVMYV